MTTSQGESFTVIVGGDWDRPLPATTYGAPRPMPTGLDWSKPRASAVSS